MKVGYASLVYPMDFDMFNN